MKTNGETKRNRETLQPETCQEAGKAIWAKIKLWEKLVKTYLQNGYKMPDRQCKIRVSGVAYKVLDRGEITVFCDAEGKALFDMENKRLEKEYALLGVQKGAEPINSDREEGKE